MTLEFVATQVSVLDLALPVGIENQVPHLALLIVVLIRILPRDIDPVLQVPHVRAPGELVD
jgi:hypothetical protein